MHIVMLVKNTFTHDARVEREAQALLAIGHSVSVVALKAGTLPEVEERDGITIVRVQRPFTKLRSLGDPTAEVRAESAVKTNIKRLVLHTARTASTLKVADRIHHSLDNLMIAAATNLNPDVIHAHDLDTLRAGSILSASLGVPLVYDSHEMATARSLGNARTNKRAKDIEGSLIHNAQLVIMASQGYADRAVELYGIDTPTVVRNIPRYRVSFNSEMNLRNRFEIPSDHQVLVHQGSLQPFRGVEQLIDAVALVPNVTLVIIGYGSHLLFLKQYVASSGLGDRIHFLGAVPTDDLLDWSSTADIGICTIVGHSDSYRHSMPNKLFEYTMSGIAVIASDYPGMGGFVRDNNIGEVCNPEDASDVASAIQRLVENPEHLEACKSNARQVRESVNWEAEAATLQSAYRNTFA